MVSWIHSQYVQSLASRGAELASGLEFILRDFFGQSQLSVVVGECVAKEDLTPPEGMPPAGRMLLYQGTLTPPAEATFTLGWLFGDELMLTAVEAAPSEEDASTKFDVLIEGLAELLESDQYELTSSESLDSSDLWNDFLLKAPTDRVVWLSFHVALTNDTTLTFWSAWPLRVVERLAGPVEPDQPDESELDQGHASDAEIAAMLASAVRDRKPAAVALPEGARRLLRTRVPVIVTLAMKEIPAKGLMDIGPGTIIEFERGCDQPLILSVNNLPIGFGEAVKIGDHFGLKVSAILSPEERAARVGGKWKFG